MRAALAFVAIMSGLAFVLIAGALPDAMPVDATPQSASTISTSNMRSAPLRDEDARVGVIAYRMGIAARPWCQRLIPLPGWVLHHLAEYDSRIRPDLIEIYALDRGPGIVAVVPGSAAAQAGLLPGDTIVSINGTLLASLTPAPAKGDRVSREPGTRLETAIEQMLFRGPASISVLRGGATVQATLAVPMGCPARIRIASAREDNAFADGEYAIFTTRIVREAKTDDELAAVVAHELAHNFLDHARRRRSGADQRPKRAQETEADAFGLRLMAAAGYNPSAAAAFWNTVLDGNVLDSLGISGHPPKSQRIKALRSELDVVNASRASVSWNGISVPRPGH